jgi:hypothetical protein
MDFGQKLPKPALVEVEEWSKQIKEVCASQEHILEMHSLICLGHVIFHQ